MASSLPCPCGTAIMGIVGDGVSAERAILAYEQAAFQVLASGAQFYVRWHDTGHTPAEAAGELGVIARQLRTTLALLERHMAETPPEQSEAATLAGELRSFGRSYAQIAAHLYREGARLDTAALTEHLVAPSDASVPSLRGGRGDR